MTYSLLLTQSAYADLEGIKQFISLDNPDNARRYIERIFAKLETLSLFAFSGNEIHNAVLDYARCRYLPVMNHVAIYQVNETAKCVYIVRILSHFQDWRSIVNKDILEKCKTIAQSERIAIAELDQSMVYDIWRNSLDEDNRKHVPDEVFETLEEANDVVNNLIESYQKESGPFVYAVLRNSDHANLGYVQLARTQEGWEIGYHIAKLYTRQGYASEALNLFLGYLKSERSLHEVWGIALSTNKPSRKVLEKCGFQTVYDGEGLYQGKKRKIVKTIRKL